jgi:hypothetical protein
VFANRLAQNFPNPFNPNTTIAFSLRDRGYVELTVFDVRGRVVRRLVRGERDAGLHIDVQWDGVNDQGMPVASGLYFYRLTAQGFTETHKMLLLR